MGSHICPHLRSALWMFGILALSAGRAHAALTITVGDVTIVDQGAGDASDTLSVIKFDVSGAGYRARGTLLQQLPTAVTPASLVLTDTLVSQVGDPGGANVTITVTSDIFNPFFPTTMLAAHLDGLYVKVDELGDVLPRATTSV